ncbi:hypothetical protein D3C72_1627380 [compost metagenome]
MMARTRGQPTGRAEGTHCTAGHGVLGPHGARRRAIGIRVQQHIDIDPRARNIDRANGVGTARHARFSRWPEQAPILLQSRPGRLRASGRQQHADMDARFRKRLNIGALQTQAAHLRAQCPVADHLQNMQLRRAAWCLSFPGDVPAAIGQPDLVGILTQVFRQ